MNISLIFSMNKGREADDCINDCIKDCINDCTINDCIGVIRLFIEREYILMVVSV